MAKAKAASAPVAVKPEARDAEFLSFYNKPTREKQTPTIVVTDPTGQTALCEVAFESIMKWDKDAEKAVFSYIKISLSKKKVEGGEMEEVKSFLIGHSDSKNTKWVMVLKPEAEKVKQAVVSC